MHCAVDTILILDTEYHSSMQLCNIFDIVQSGLLSCLILKPSADHIILEDTF